MKITVTPLGAGQEVGRSCILVDFADEKRVLLDCGIHMAYNDLKKYPDFNFLLKKYQKNSINEIIDLVLISHFHLDHCAALPVLTEEFGYAGPIYTSDPTKAIIPFMLEDFMKVCGDSIYEYTKEKIANCSSKIKIIYLNQTLLIDGISFTTYYAGHVLGAVMFSIIYKNKKVVYTGDFNSSADRHLGACHIDKLDPDILISEGTYATVNREWKKEREMQFMDAIKKTFDRGGKVLIPVFALGRAQEIFALIEDIWERCGWKYPVYFSAGLTQKVRFFYKAFVNWTNHNIKSQLLENGKSVFDLKHIEKFERPYSRLDLPMIIIATPGMLHGGTSLEVFKDLCEDPQNYLLIPGYCVPGTLGNKLLNGIRQISIDGKQYDVKMEVNKMSFSAHADNKGIINLVHHLNPGNLIFVHGEKVRIENLQKYIEKTLKIPTFCPANFQNLDIIIDTPDSLIYNLKKRPSSEKMEVFESEANYLATFKSGEFWICEKIEQKDVIVRRVNN